MELRRQVYISKLTRLGVYEARDGRVLQKLTVDELELELLDREESGQCMNASK